ncbi:hypothetical protein BDY21DRAFT_280873 [Lineolata rhizophorae]|uniref:C2H2-type domain-containing protein n=1 Tax=Lineolata rhizophorae TaxID=578093 RepID=A0A6A6P7B0_9PEZI|nr:hypothetical protein BDY21DRAFT_280873 [Lineolata rhizophorae]
MAMAVDSRQHSQMSMGYDSIRYQPQFTNPWVSASPATAAPATSQAYPSSLAPNVGTYDNSTQQASRTTAVSNPYASVSVSAPSIGAGSSLPAGTFATTNSLDPIQDPLMATTRNFAAGGFTSSASPNSATFAPTSAPQYAMDYGSSRSPFQYQQQQQPQQAVDQGRRSSQPSVPSTTFLGSPVESQKQRRDSMVDLNNRMNAAAAGPQGHRNSFSDALDASRGMVAMSQTDMTPRNIYGGNPRGSTDSYGFPSAHSAHSSISSASTYPSYYNGSVGDSVTDYSSASESVEPSGSRTLPPPPALVGATVPVPPPSPQSMMSHFNSKVSTTSQKKHKCKICDKRFTRPSSLQTHMYSHTGEKPFACEVEGCGRHFSVVSNLRRHKKVHKGERDHPSPDDM